MIDQHEDLSKLNSPVRKYIFGFLAILFAAILMLTVRYITTPKHQTIARSKSDDQICEEIVKLHKKIIAHNWELVIPLNDFDSEIIDATTLGQRTSKSRSEVLKIGMKMRDLAKKLQDKQDRSFFLSFTDAILKRHKGITLLIEGHVEGDLVKQLSGEQIFEEGRTEIMNNALGYGDPSDPNYQMLRVLSENE